MKPFRSFLYLAMLASVLFSCRQNQTAQETQQDAQQHTQPDTQADTQQDTQPIPDSARASSEKQAPESIEAIKQAYASTMDQLQAHALDSVIVEYNCDNERQGQVVYYSQEGELALIEHRYAEYDHHSATDSYFVRDSSLYFGLFSKVSWMFVAQELTQDNFTEQRTYIIGEQAVRCLEKQYIILSDQPGKRQKETQNEVIPCSDIGEVLSDFKKILAFKDQPAPDCLQL